MACKKCEQTDCLVSSSFPLKDGKRIFTDLRFDLENNQLDMNYGELDDEGRAIDAEWSASIDIKFCPFCGEELPKVV